MSEHLYLATKNTVCAIEKASGKIAWGAKLRRGIFKGGSSFVSLADDEMHLFAHTHGYLYCLSKSDGRVLWENELSGLGYQLAMLSGGVVPVSTGSEHLYLATTNTVCGIEKASGNIAWEAELHHGVFGSGSSFVSLVDDETHLFAHTRGYLYCLSKSDSRVVWENELSGLGYELAMLSAGVVPASIGSERMYLATKNTVCAIEKASGNIAWRTEPLRHGLFKGGSSFVSLVDDETHLFAHTRGYLYCLSKSDSRVVWENELSGLGYEVAMLSAGVVPVSTGSEHLYLATNNTVCAIEKESGKIAWGVELPHGLNFVSLVDDETHLFAHTHGYLYCLTKSDGRVLGENKLSGLGYELAMLSAGILSASTGHQTPLFAEDSKSSGGGGGGRGGGSNGGGNGG